MQKVHVWDKVDFAEDQGGRGHAELLKEKDIWVELNCYLPGVENRLHRHLGGSQTFLVLQGEVLLTVVDENGQTQETVLKVGDAATVPAGEYYKIKNVGQENLVVYRVRAPYDQVALYEMGGKAYSQEERMRVEKTLP